MWRLSRWNSCRHPTVFKDVSHNFWSFSDISLSTQPEWPQLKECRVAAWAGSCGAQDGAAQFGMHQPETRNFPPLKTQTCSLPSQAEAALLSESGAKPSAWSRWRLCSDTVCDTQHPVPCDRVTGAKPWFPLTLGFRVVWWSRSSLM